MKKILAYNFGHTHPKLEELASAVLPSFTENGKHVIVDAEDYRKIMGYLQYKGIKVEEIEEVDKKRNGGNFSNVLSKPQMPKGMMSCSRCQTPFPKGTTCPICNF